MICNDCIQFWSWINFSKKTAPGAVFSRDFQNLKKKGFFFWKKWKFFKTSFLSFSMSFSLVTLIFFQWKLRLHTFEWWEVYVAQTNKSSHLKPQSAFEKWKKAFFSTDSKIVAFKLQMCPNSILTSEMELTTHFWSRTTLVHVYHTYRDLCVKKTKEPLGLRNVNVL